jgi:hypothetical protein
LFESFGIKVIEVFHGRIGRVDGIEFGNIENIGFKIGNIDIGSESVGRYDRIDVLLNKCLLSNFGRFRFDRLICFFDEGKEFLFKIFITTKLTLNVMIWIHIIMHRRAQPWTRKGKSTRPNDSDDRVPPMRGALPYTVFSGIRSHLTAASRSKRLETLPQHLSSALA